jgi:class 3 adenylate cyclase/HAMP domain-containing protein
VGTVGSGSWSFAEYPIFNSAGKAVGMFELGLDMTSYRIQNILQSQQIALISALICFFIVVVVAMLTSVIVKQLQTTARVFSAISGGNYSLRTNYHARDELGTVCTSLNAMADKLEKQITYIKKFNNASLRFVPVQFMEHLGVPDITLLKLGDFVHRDFTVLFFDIRSFSIHSELMTVQDNFMFVNKVLSIAGPIFRKYNGFVDKYMGDAAMALFANAYDAVRSGIELYRTLILDEATKIKIGIDGINIGVGLHTGSVMMGIVGENERLSSTVISENVNMSSRMESLTKQTKSGVLITRDTLNMISGHEREFEYRFIGMVRVAGVNRVIGVFDMLDALPDITRKRRLATREVFESGIRKYHTKEYEAAYERFKKVLA